MKNVRYFLHKNGLLHITVKMK